MLDNNAAKIYFFTHTTNNYPEKTALLTCHSRSEEQLINVILYFKTIETYKQTA